MPNLLFVFHSRVLPFFSQVLFDLGVVSTKEPFGRLVRQFITLDHSSASSTTQLKPQILRFFPPGVSGYDPGRG